MDVVVFTVGGQCFGVPVATVEEVVSIAEIAPLPGAPPSIRGVLNVRGRVTPVVDLQRHFTGSWTDVRLEHRLLLVRTPSRHLALINDDVLGVQHIDDAAVDEMASLLPGLGRLEAVVATETGLLFVHDVELLLSAAEEAQLAVALGEA